MTRLFGLTAVENEMHQDKCVELARQAAVDCGERHDYMPATELLAETWHPHRWVVDAMLLAADEAERERDAFKAGNTELLELPGSTNPSCRACARFWRAPGSCARTTR